MESEFKNSLSAEKGKKPCEGTNFHMIAPRFWCIFQSKCSLGGILMFKHRKWQVFSLQAVCLLFCFYVWPFTGKRYICSKASTASLVFSVLSISLNTNSAAATWKQGPKLSNYSFLWIFCCDLKTHLFNKHFMSPLPAWITSSSELVFSSYTSEKMLYSCRIESTFFISVVPEIEAYSSGVHWKFLQFNNWCGRMSYPISFF